MREYDGPPRTFQEVKRLNRVLLDAFYALGKSRYTDGRMEWAQTQSKMRANRSAFERYAVKHYPQWTHPEMMRQLWRARSAYIDSPCEPTLDVLCHVQYNLWHTDFIETYEQADAGKLDLSDPFSGLAQGSGVGPRHADAWQDPTQEEKPASQGRALGERLQRERVGRRDDRGCRGRCGDRRGAVGHGAWRAGSACRARGGGPASTGWNGRAHAARDARRLLRLSPSTGDCSARRLKITDAMVTLPGRVDASRTPTAQGAAGSRGHLLTSRAPSVTGVGWDCLG